MENNTEVLIAVAVLTLTALAAWILYRWQQRKRVHRVEEWVKDYLYIRYGELPNALRIDCSEDLLWPVLVAFDTPRTGIQHNMRFTCRERLSTCALLSEKDDKR